MKKQRIFKTSWFSKRSKKALITDKALCDAIEQVKLNQADDLGGGVFKKRLKDNMYRSIILAKCNDFWVYEYIFAKSKIDNIEDDRLRELKLLAKIYAGLTAEQLTLLIDRKDLIEICNEETL
jgi:hypothetical protein